MGAPEQENAMTAPSDALPVAKKMKLQSEDDDAVEVPSVKRLQHPFGVKPIGNFYEDAAKGIKECRSTGLGSFSCLSDFQMLSLLNYMTARDLCVLSAASRAMYVFSSHDELWRTLVLEELESSFTPQSTWKEAYVATKRPDLVGKRKRQPIVVQGFYSDLLFQAFYCANAPIEPSWLAVETIDRRSASSMSLEEFKRDYELANRPVIITEAIDKWPGITKWTDDYLIDVCKGQTFSAGGFQFSMEQYLHYSRTLLDDQSLFIFDKEFARKVPSLADDYNVPVYFQEDFFSLLGDQRPDYRWLIIGPARSGSTFHIDPNSTNAWNGIIRGAKKWIMFPPEITPPGVHPSEDGGDVSTPVSLMEWFVTFYPQVKKLPAHLKPLEGICREGEIIFVPNGWWHIVLNIEESIAITQNFVCSGNVKNVVRFLKNKPDQVSGLPCEERPHLYQRFRSALQQHMPERLAAIESELDEEWERKHRKSKWEILLEDNHTAAASSASESCQQESKSTFGFGFSFE